MRLKYAILALAVFAIASVTSCVKEKDAPAADNRELVTISVSVPDADTKVAFSEGAQNGLHLAWEEGDCLRVISGNQSERYDILEGFTEHNARFRGPEVSGSTYTIIYPGDFESVADAEEFDGMAVVQEGNGSTAHLRWMAVLQDINTKDDISFTADWADSHNGTLRRNGVVKFELTLPAAVQSPRKVELTGPEFSIGVPLENIDLGASHVLTAYAIAPIDDIEIDPGTPLTVTVTDADGSLWARTKYTSGEAAIRAGEQNIFRLTKGFEECLFAGGDGSEESPYLISAAKHLYNMNAVMEQGTKKWFRMIADVDMSTVSEAWLPLNATNPYGCEVDFNGDGHVIDNFSCSDTEHCPGFFTVLFGDVHNVSFTNATINKTNDNNGHPCGILGGYGGYNGRPSRVWDVHVQGSVTSTAVNGVGGMFGRVNTIDIESCSADVTVVSAGGGRSGLVGGLFGYETAAVTVRNCWTSGSVTGSDKVGGIGGGFIKSESSMYNCFSTAEVNGSFQAGGILGHANLDDKKNNATNLPDNHVERCIAWNPSVKSTATDANEHYSSGAIIGYTAVMNYLVDCYRMHDFSFTECPKNTELGYGLTDQENANPSSPLKHSANTYDFAYHGKSAAQGKTLSQVARDLGWSETAWNLSGSVPTLTGVPEFETSEPVQSGDLSAPHGSNPKPGQGEIRPSGSGWNSKSIANGITYYTFAGTETVTGKKQEVFIIDLDLSNPNYRVKFVYASPATSHSNVFAAQNAVASTNGGYELGSIVFKAEGIGYSYMPNNTITSGTGASVPNWKSEGAVYSDGNRNVKIRFDGYGLSIKQQRQYYLYNTGEWPNVISSAPMLVYDFNPVGEVFVDPSLTSSQINALGNQCTENPNYHQGVRHPRTAIALTEGNHLLLIAVDGRHNGYSYGMTAKELTKFLVNNFNPQYALNLDGGGSTTMCVRGEGDSTTHVVNYPSDDSDSGHNHNGERQLRTHICIVEN